MTRAWLLAPAVLAAALVAPSARAGCPHLVADPRGDVHQTVASPDPAVEDVRENDLLSVDLTDTPRTITATFHVAALGGQTVEAHLYELGFSTETDRWYLRAQHGLRGEDYELVHLVGSRDAPEDTGAGGGALAVTVTGTYRPGTATLTVTAPRSEFGESLRGPLQLIRANVWHGVEPPAGGVYLEAADRGRTDRTYRLGRTRC